MPEYVFLDTSIFESQNFLEGKNIREIFSLAETGEIIIVLPQITYQEILKRIEKNINEEYSNFKRYRDDNKVLRNIPSFQPRFERFKKETAIAEMQDLFIKQLKASKVLVIDYPELNIGNVFQKYFDNEFPFSRSKESKKHEFPDAFALHSLEIWCQQNRRNCYAVSADGDMQNYKSNYFTIEKGLAEYLNRILLQINEKKTSESEAIKTAISLYKESTHSIEEELKVWLEEQLDSHSTYVDAASYFNEVHNIDIKSSVVNIMNYQLVGINGREITIQIEADGFYEIELTVDDENSKYHDYDDGIWYYTETAKVDISDDVDITCQLIFTIPASGRLKDMDYKIDDINDGSDITIKF